MALMEDVIKLVAKAELSRLAGSDPRPEALRAFLETLYCGP